MANEFKPNKLTNLIAVRAAESGAYLTVGSKSYVADQLRPNMRNDSTYRFVVKDAGKFVKGPSLETTDVSTLKERQIEVTPDFGNIVIGTDQYKDVVEANWDKEIAIPNGKALIEGVVAEAIKKDLGRQNVAFVGTGFLPLSKASRALGSITSDKRYGFIDPMIDSVLATVGKGFDPVNADPIASKGMFGAFAGTEFREQQFLPSIEISADLANELSSATVSGIDQSATGYDLIKLNGVTETIPAGTPLFIDGIYAANLVGNKMSFNKAFIAIEDATAGSVKVRKVDLVGQATKEAVKADGSNVAVADFGNAKLVNPIAAGTYYMGIIRTEGAQEFDTFKNLDWSNADQTSESIEGIYVHEGRVVDILKGTNTTRWTVASVSQCIEPRCSALVLVKDAQPNLVSM
jgi:3D (Asp-Asp-Asp) domain-containing protein